MMIGTFGAQFIDTAYSAEDALNKCKYEQYDVIICDYNLGSGKNGQNILEELRFRKRLKNTHLFILVTAETSRDIVLGAREYLPDAYIAKPITKPVLKKRLDQMLVQQQILKPVNKEIDLQNYPKAITLCHQMLEDGTRYQSWCYQTLAKLYSLSGDLGNAKKIYEGVLSNRELVWAQVGLGEVYAAERQNEKAIACFQKALDLNPNIIEAYDGISETRKEMGQLQAAQEALEEAVKLSPRVVKRHEKLADICEKNQQLDSAAEAYRNAIKFSENSVFDRSQNYLNLGRCLADVCQGEESASSTELANEALAVLQGVSHKFPAEESSMVNALLIETRVHLAQHNHDLAKHTLQQAENLMGQDEMPAEVGLELAKTLYAIGDELRAEAILSEMAARFAGHQAIIEQIELLLDEPVNVQEKVKAREFNRQGIQLFEKGDLLTAIDAFETALEYTPKHPALNLNLIQTLIKSMETAEGTKHECVQKAKQALQRISHIPEQHRQYKRMLYLEKTIARLEQEPA